MAKNLAKEQEVHFKNYADTEIGKLEQRINDQLGETNSKLNRAMGQIEQVRSDITRKQEKNNKQLASNIEEAQQLNGQGLDILDRWATEDREQNGRAILIYPVTRKAMHELTASLEIMTAKLKLIQDSHKDLQQSMEGEQIL